MKNTAKKPRGISAALGALSRPVDLTSGTPWRVILLYAAPIILSYYLQQIYTLTDAIICGQVLTAEQVAGVNDTMPLTFIFCNLPLAARRASASSPQAAWAAATCTACSQRQIAEK